MEKIIDSTLQIEYSLIKKLEKNDTSNTVNFSQQNFTDVGNLVQPSNVSARSNIANVLEHNFFVLDSTIKINYENLLYPIYAKDLSSNNGTFSTVPKATINFNKLQNFAGLTLNFIDNYPLEMIIIAYSNNGVRQSVLSDINSLSYSWEQPIFDCFKLELYFTRIMPNRFLKMQNLNVGIVLLFDENVILSGNKVEEIDPISKNISINTLNFEILDKQHKFDQGNEFGLHRFFEKNQVVIPYRCLNEKRHQLGKFYTTSLESGEDKVKFACGDLIKILESKQCLNDYDTRPIDFRIWYILVNQAGLSKSKNFFLDETTYIEKGSALHGNVEDCRKALQKALFSTGLRCSTDDYGNLVISDRTYTSSFNVISRKNKISTKVTKRDLVTNITLKWKEYSRTDPATRKILVSDTQDVGTYTYTIGDIIHSAGFYTDNVEEPATGQMTDIRSHQLTVAVTKAGSFELRGEVYTSTENMLSIPAKNLSPYTETNELTFQCDEVASRSQAQQLIELLYDYYNNNPVQVEIKYLLEDYDLDKYPDIFSAVQVDNPNSDFSNYICRFTSITTDLVGGFVATAKLYGYYNYVTNDYYAGDELIADNDIII